MAAVGRNQIRDALKSDIGDDGLTTDGWNTKRGIVTLRGPCWHLGMLDTDGMALLLKGSILLELSGV